MRSEELRDVFGQSSLLGFGNHHPSRTLNNVRRNATIPEVWKPMLGLAAAPEIEIACPKVTPPPKRLSLSFVGANPTAPRLEPHRSGVNENEALLRVWTDKSELPPRFIAQFTMGNGPRNFRAACRSSSRLKSSLASKPVKTIGFSLVRGAQVTPDHAVSVELIQAEDIDFKPP
jgi:hypothetical protein